MSEVIGHSRPHPSNHEAEKETKKTVKISADITIATLFSSRDPVARGLEKIRICKLVEISER